MLHLVHRLLIALICAQAYGAPPGFWDMLHHGFRPREIHEIEIRGDIQGPVVGIQRNAFKQGLLRLHPKRLQGLQRLNLKSRNPKRRNSEYTSPYSDAKRIPSVLIHRPTPPTPPATTDTASYVTPAAPIICPPEIPTRTHSRASSIYPSRHERRNSRNSVYLSMSGSDTEGEDVRFTPTDLWKWSSPSTTSLQTSTTTT
ncbi:hypothetical protein FIBSPDRAFT_966433 [Athelia psychrophila]|uniref:Uncharacterized protein n=1 Tax=Athelia psychrophila TaxID=1759441 RepID=A0A167WU05_9AGAM|nr:hypothetical protein FIBSPDRAFT_966433 [Fibularhizoctonia sp. CBS 109695]